MRGIILITLILIFSISLISSATFGFNSAEIVITTDSATGDCPVGQVVQNITATEIECISPGAVSDTNETTRVNEIAQTRKADQVAFERGRRELGRGLTGIENKIFPKVRPGPKRLPRVIPGRTAGKSKTTPKRPKL